MVNYTLCEQQYLQSLCEQKYLQSSSVIRTVAREGCIRTSESVVTRDNRAAKSSVEGSKRLSSVMGTAISATVSVGVKVRSSVIVE